jgi:hypothetical protein
MDSTTLNSLTQVAQVVLITATLICIYLQLRQQTKSVEQQNRLIEQQNKLAKVANAQALIELVSPQAFQVIQDRQLADFLVNGAEKYGRMEEVDRYRYRQLVAWRLNCWENMFFQNQHELLDEAIYSTWTNAYERWVKKNLNPLWDELKNNYHPEFQSYIEKLLNDASEGVEKKSSAAPSA